MIRIEPEAAREIADDVGKHVENKRRQKRREAALSEKRDDERSLAKHADNDSPEGKIYNYVNHRVGYEKPGVRVGAPCGREFFRP